MMEFKFVPKNENNGLKFHVVWTGSRSGQTTVAETDDPAWAKLICSLLNQLKDQETIRDTLTWLTT